jgi:hypothetical protein
MQAKERKSCYGGMTPESLPAEFDRRSVGKVFSFVVVSPVGLARPARRLEVDRQAWDDCVRCPEFEHCDKLSMARLALEAAVASF